RTSRPSETSSCYEPCLQYYSRLRRLESHGGIMHFRTATVTSRARRMLPTGHHAGHGEHAQGLCGGIAQALRSLQSVHRVHLGGGFTPLLHQGRGVALSTSRLPNVVNRGKGHIKVFSGLSFVSVYSLREAVRGCGAGALAGRHFAQAVRLIGTFV